MKWEYYVIDIRKRTPWSVEESLNKLARLEGWELVSADNEWLYLRRAVEEEREEMQ